MSPSAKRRGAYKPRTKKVAAKVEVPKKVETELHVVGDHAVSEVVRGIQESVKSPREVADEQWLRSEMELAGKLRRQAEEMQREASAKYAQGERKFRQGQWFGFLGTLALGVALVLAIISIVTP